ncbi:hypothetical protein D3C76_1347970 [compost metagenome]
MHRPHKTDIADGSRIQPLLHLPESWQPTPVEGHIERHSRFAACLNHRRAFRRIHRHRLLHIDRLSGTGRCQGILLMGGRRSRNINRIHLGIGNQLIRLPVPAGHPMASGIILRQCSVPSHNCSELGALRLLQRRTAFDLRHIAAPDNSPPNDVLHSCASFGLFHYALFQIEPTVVVPVLYILSIVS